jgi:hypothetical protein
LGQLFYIGFFPSWFTSGMHYHAGAWERVQYLDKGGNS